MIPLKWHMPLFLFETFNSPMDGLLFEGLDQDLLPLLSPCGHSISFTKLL